MMENYFPKINVGCSVTIFGEIFHFDEILKFVKFLKAYLVLGKNLGPTKICKKILILCKCHRCKWPNIERLIWSHCLAVSPSGTETDWFDFFVWFWSENKLLITKTSFGKKREQSQENDWCLIGQMIGIQFDSSFLQTVWHDFANLAIFCKSLGNF